MMTTAQLNTAIGQTVSVRVETYRIPMLVSDVRTVWGRVNVQVTPVHGTGTAWVSIERCAAIV